MLVYPLTMSPEDLADAMADLTPGEWRAILLAAAEHRCVACGHHDQCECSEEIDVAKVLLVNRTAHLSE